VKSDRVRRAVTLLRDNGVAIYGHDLSAATAVTFGGTPSASFVAVADGNILAFAPAYPAGTFQVLATTPGDTSPSVGVHYTYLEVSATTSVAAPSQAGWTTPRAWAAATG
jgi:hypothetical protein